MNWLAVAIFSVTYVAIASRRLSWLPLDRPAAVLVGAVVCVASGVLTPHQALGAIDGETILLLFAVMGMGAFLAADGLVEQLEARLDARSPSPRFLLGAVVWSAGLMAPFITNDAVALLGAPIVLRLTRRYGLAPLPYLLALATAANTGSVATLVGNPQNMLCAQLGGLAYREFLLVMGPLALLCLALNHAWLAWLFRRQLDAPAAGGAGSAVHTGGDGRTGGGGSAVHDGSLLAGGAALPGATRQASSSGRSALTLTVVAGVAVAYLFNLNLAWTAAAGFALLMLVHRRDTRELWSRIDFPLLLFFGGLFIVVEALRVSGAPDAFFARYPLASLWTDDGLLLSAVFVVGSNVVSNVPFILVIADAMGSLPDPVRAWSLLAAASTFAGNLTLLGSVATIIVAEAARDEGGIGFIEHLRAGAPLALVTTAVAALWVQAAAWAGAFG